MSYRSTVSGRATFAGLLRSEWTKLRSVPRWVLTMGAMVVLTVLVALLTAVGSATSSAEAPKSGAGGGGGSPGMRDGGELVHRALSGDGSLVARVTSQDDSHEWAKAGLMVRAGASYAMVVVTPTHGVRLLSTEDDEVAGGPGGAPRWLRLDRDGGTVTGYESADGKDWRRVGAVELELPDEVMAGLFVASPREVRVQRQFGGETIDEVATQGRATFADVRVSGQDPAPWRDRAGQGSDVDGLVTLTGSGDVGPNPFADDITRTTLGGALVGVIALVALAVLFVTAEYRRGMVLSTFAASPRRGRVFAAKALVLGAATFAAGLVASFAAFLVATPIMHGKGMRTSSLADEATLRAVLGTAALLAVVAVFTLAVATALRRTTPAITLVLLVLLVPQVVATGLPLSVALWLERLTPAAGFSVQQTVQRYDSAMAPWAGLAVLCGYAAVAVVWALWRLRRRDA